MTEPILVKINKIIKLVWFIVNYRFIYGTCTNLTSIDKPNKAAIKNCWFIASNFMVNVKELNKQLHENQEL